MREIAWRAQQGSRRNIPVRASASEDRLTEKEFLRLAHDGVMKPYWYAVSYWDTGGELSLNSLALMRTAHIVDVFENGYYDLVPYREQEKGTNERLAIIDWSEFIKRGHPMKIYPSELADALILRCPNSAA